MQGHEEGSPLPLLAIGGATAVGKSAAALGLAELLRGEGIEVALVSADSRQVFRGFDIGTDKLDRDTLARWPHAGIDVADADLPFTLFDWLEIARPAASTRPQGAGAGAAPRLAIVVGGTGLYHRGLLRGFLRGGSRPHDAGLRGELEALLAADGREPLDARLATLQPEVAAQMLNASPRRLVRALEIAFLGGDASAPEEQPWGAPHAYVTIDDPDPVHHRAAITARIEEQFVRGLVAEAVALAERLPPETPALSGIGYAEALRHNEAEITREHAVGAAAARTWDYARRQRTWFRAEPIDERIVGGAERSTVEIAAALHVIAQRLITAHPSGGS
ncbi:MAG: tRNA (adenosine(37)-N6)-dimethylallyltransferase MiaA [Chloroflexi bacterium]|nr:MAG: tRNA (adenosine(37)-N6)-dimethylallyltransferase MiaA [Chloroflexota bacterium]